MVARLTSPRPVTVDGTPFTLEGRQVCPRLVTALPGRLGRLPARQVKGARTSAAAWGDPPVILRCGVPPRIAPASQIVVLNGVEWFTDVDNTGVTWTTAGRRVNVQVRVPGRYDSQGPLLSGVSPAVESTVPKS